MKIVNHSFDFHGKSSINAHITSGISFDFPCCRPSWPKAGGENHARKKPESRKESIYIDLEKASDRAKLVDAELFIKAFWLRSHDLDLR